MKKIILIFSILVGVFAFPGAQTQNPQGGNGGWNPAASGPQLLVYGQISQSLMERIFFLAEQDLFPSTGLKYPDLMDCYKTGALILTYLGQKRFRVEVGGGLTIIGLMDF